MTRALGRILAVLVMAVTATGCTSEEEKRMDLEAKAEQVATDARQHIDELATAVGTDPEVRQDTITACVPGQDDSGLDLIYIVRVQVQDDVMDRLVDEIGPRYADEGWDVQRRGDDNVVFRRDNVTMGATIFDNGEASVSGSGGCVT